MEHFLSVFSMLLLQSLVACGKVTPSFTRSLSAEDTSSPLSTNYPNYQSNSFLPWNSSMSVEASDAVDNKSMLNCENTTLDTERYSFLLNVVYSRILSSLNSTSYVQDGDLLTVCRKLFLERLNKFLTVLLELFSSLILLLVNLLMPNSFYHGRRGFAVLILILLSCSSSWFLLHDGSAEDLCNIVHVLAGVANIVLMSIYTWVNIFTSSFVVNYLYRQRFIKIVAHSDNQYSVHIVDEIFIPRTAWFLGVFLFVLTYFTKAIEFPKPLLKEFPDIIAKDSIFFYFVPAYLLIILTWVAAMATNNVFHCPEVGDFRHKVQFLQVPFSSLLFTSIVNYAFVFYFTATRRIGPNWLYYVLLFVVAAFTLAEIFFLRKFSCSSEFDYEANAEQQREDFIYMFRIFSDVDNKYVFGWSAFDWEKAKRRYQEESGMKSSMRASWKLILHELGL